MQNLSKDLVIYTGDELIGKLVTGRPFRPHQSFILLIRKGSFRVRYNLTEHQITDNGILFINKNMIYEFVETNYSGDVLLIAINPSFDSISAIKIRNHQVFQLIPHTYNSHFHTNEEEMEEAWQLTKIVR